MKMKHIIIFSLVSILAYQCSSKKSTSSLLPLVQSETKTSGSSSGYYFKEYSNSNKGRVAFNNIKSMTGEIRAAVSKSGSGRDTTCTGKSLAAIGTGNAIASNNINYIYAQKLKSLVPSTQEGEIKKLIDAAIVASAVNPGLLAADGTLTAGTTVGPTEDGFVSQWTHTSSTSGTKKSLSCYLQSGEGVEYVQYIEKGLFSIPYSQGMKILDGIKSEDNTDAKTKYSAREKKWDELFGYFGAPQNYSIANYKAGLLSGQLGLHNGYGMYRSLNDAVKDVPGQTSIRGYADDIMQNGFIAGRNAITNNDNTALDKAIAVVKQRWEHAIIIGGLSYAYYGYGALKGSKKAITDKSWTAIGKNHVLNEGFGMFWALNYGATTHKSNFTEADINYILTRLGGNAGITVDNAGTVTAHNVDAATSTAIQEVRTKIVEKYPELANAFKME